MKTNLKPSTHNAIDPASIAKNLSTLMSKSSISESELAKALNVPYNTIHRLINGSTLDPRVSTLKIIADYFKVSLDRIINDENALTENTRPSPYSFSVPIFTWEDISTPYFFDNIDLNKWINWQPIPASYLIEQNEKIYGIESKPSMQPRFPLGTLLIINQDTTPIDSDLVLIHFKKDNAASLRELVIDPPIKYLISTVTGSPTINFDETLHSFIGVVVLTIFHTRGTEGDFLDNN